MIIIGIDPGTATTGYGVIKKTKKKAKKQLKCLEYGIIETKPSATAEQRLKKIYREVSRLLRKYQPEVVVVEKIYFFKNSKTVIRVSEARGVILLSAATKKIKTEELTPLQVKMSICGYGRAEKVQIQRMIKSLLDLKEIPKPDDAADALAIAVSYAHSLK